MWVARRQYIYGMRLLLIGVGSITEVKQRRVRSIIGWVTRLGLPTKWWYMVSGDFGRRLFWTGDFGRLSVISDGDFGRCAIKSDCDFGRCAVNSDAAVNSDPDFGRCAVNSDAQLSSLLYHYFGSNIASFGRWFRTVISDGDFGRWDV